MNKVEELKRIKRIIQHKETGLLSIESGVNQTIVSMYLNHAGKIVLNSRKVDKIIKAWQKIEPMKIRQE